MRDGFHLTPALPMLLPEDRGPYLNRVEPPFLIEAFLNHPPEGFTPMGIGPADRPVPAFTTRFDLLTTLDDSIRRILKWTPLLFAKPLLRPKTLFVGTTVSEYLPYPPAVPPADLIRELLERVREEGLPFLILKDIPFDSPFLTRHENETAAALLTRCQEAGFSILSGQALAYAPIDFDSVEAYLQRLSHARRKDLRRKLRARPSIEVEEIQTGAPVFSDEAPARRLYDLYLNVFRQSEIQFDRLTFPFFHAILQNGSAQGIVFLYRRQGKIIGWNLCFVYGDRLVDKYVGFVYPDAREANLYFISWFHNLEYALKRRLKYYIAGWTDPRVKAFLGAKFTFTRHAVYPRNRALRFALGRLKRLFEADQSRANREAGSRTSNREAESRTSNRSEVR